MYTSILIAFSMIGKNMRQFVDILAIFLSIYWIIELIIMNLPLVAPIKSFVLLIVELLLYIPIVLVFFSC